MTAYREFLTKLGRGIGKRGQDWEPTDEEVERFKEWCNQPIKEGSHD